ncbi:MAG: sulfatase-like hydrolase/transferase [Fimbriimonadaceae bacterium]|nr:sulfatase-like hydrolase/transferase [Fimbriimonadaceae bacterium]
MRPNRRRFVQTGAAALGAAALPRAGAQARRPNLLLIVCDQLNLDGMSALGNPHVRTPNLDRLAARSTLFTESLSPNPVCSPARSALFTGRMPVETGVVTNDRPIRAGLPNLGEWFRANSNYTTAYCGKWHVPNGIFAKDFKGFTPLVGGGRQGCHDDTWVTTASEAFLRAQARRQEPWLLVSSYMQPHDICYWMIHPQTLVSDQPPLANLTTDLPALPPNHRSRPVGPARVGNGYTRFTTDEQWRYYLYAYYRMVEMLDQDVGRLLDALDETGQADNTVVVFTSDHGEGAGRHGNVQKWHPYDESLKVPFLISWPGQIAAGKRDSAHLVSLLDISSTFCDYAGLAPPPLARGRSVRPLAEGRQVEWRDHLVCEWQGDGRIVRTPRHKLVTYRGDPQVQLFDIVEDPWETTTLAAEARHGETIAAHQKLLAEWDRRMDVCPLG